MRRRVPPVVTRGLDYARFVTRGCSNNGNDIIFREMSRYLSWAIIVDAVLFCVREKPGQSIAQRVIKYVNTGLCVCVCVRRTGGNTRDTRVRRALVLFYGNSLVSVFEIFVIVVAVSPLFPRRHFREGYISRRFFLFVFVFLIRRR